MAMKIMEADMDTWIARYGYSIGGTSHTFNWFWIRDEYTTNERGNATHFASAELARAAAKDAISGAVVIQPHLQFRFAVEKVQQSKQTEQDLAARCPHCGGFLGDHGCVTIGCEGE